MTIYKIICENKFDGVILMATHKQIEYISSLSHGNNITCDVEALLDHGVVDGRL